MNKGIRGVLFWQAVAGLLGSISIAIWLDGMLALSVAYGVLLTMFSGFWLGSRIGRVGEIGKAGGQRLLYSGAAWRFLGVLAALLLAAAIGLHLLAVAGGMLLAQVALFTYAARHAGDGGTGTDCETQTRDRE